MDNLTEIEKLAGLAFTPEEIGIILEDETIIRDIMAGKAAMADCDQPNPVYNAYMRGKLKKQAEIRTAVSGLASSGSHPAQQMMVAFFEKQKMEE